MIFFVYHGIIMFVNHIAEYFSANPMAICIEVFHKFRYKISDFILHFFFIRTFFLQQMPFVLPFVLLVAQLCSTNDFVLGHALEENCL